MSSDSGHSLRSPLLARQRMSSFDQTEVDEEEMDEEEEYDAHDDNITLLPTRRSMSFSPSKSSPLSTPSRSSTSRHSTQKSSITRLAEYIFDILDANDVLPDNERTTLSKTATEFFVWQNGKAVLRVEVLGKLVSLLRSCTSSNDASSSRSNATTSASSSICPSSDPESSSVIDVDDVMRLLKVLHRCMRDGQSLDPFASSTKKRPALAQLSPNHAKRNRSAHPRVESEEIRLPSNEGDGDKEDDSKEFGELQQAPDRLATLAYTAAAARCALMLLSNPHTDEALRCDDMVLPCMQVMRSVVQDVVLPFMAACTGASATVSPSLSTLIDSLGLKATTKTSKSTKINTTAMSSLTTQAEECRHHLSKSFDALQHLLVQTQQLASLSGWTPSDASLSILTHCILPLFTASDNVIASSTSQSKASGKTVPTKFAFSKGSQPSLLASLRVPALYALQSLYKRCTDEQQAYTISIILDHLGGLHDLNRASRRQYGLENGKSIHSLSALLLQLIQGSTRPFKASTVGPEDAIPNASQQSVNNSNTSVDTTVDMELLRLQLNEPRDVAKRVAEGLLGKVKAGILSKSSGATETGLSPALDCIMQDLLDALFLPCWPSASLLLSNICRLFCASLEDRQSTPDLRGVAIDFLGVVAARMYESKVRMRSVSPNDTAHQETISRLSINDTEPNHAQTLETLATAYEKLVQNLRMRDAKHSALVVGAEQFLQAQWIVEIACVHRKIMEKMDVADIARFDAAEENEEETRHTTELLQRLDQYIRRITSPVSELITSVKANGKEEQTQSVQGLFEAVLHTFNYMVPTEYIQHKLIESSGGPVASNRAKALRAISAISQVNDEFLRQDETRTAIQRCLMDESVHVRDAAVALLGRFVLANTAYMEALFPNLRAKIDDTGLLVRKRTLRLLSDMYNASTSTLVQAEAAFEIARCVRDEEQSMRELAVDSLAALWFTASTKSGDEQESLAPSSDATDSFIVPADLQTPIVTLVEVANRLNGRHSGLEEALVQLLQSEGKKKSTQKQILRLVDGLASMIAAEMLESSLSETRRYTKTLLFLIRHLPSALSVSQAKILLPCVRSCTSQDELVILGDVLEIFTTCLPVMRKTAISFARQLQDLLRPLISQPSPHLSVLPELVRCYAVVVQHQTKDFAILVKTLQQCHRLMCNVVCRARSKKIPAVADRNDAVVIRLLSLLVETVDFDQVRHDMPKMAAGINEVTRRPIKDETITLLIRLLDNSTFVPHALNGMRFLFRAFPTLTLNSEVHEMLMSILSTPPQEMAQEKAIVLRTLAEVLTVEEERKSTSDQANGFGELVGNTETLANPVSFELMQTYLEPVLHLTCVAALQPMILDIMQHILMRGMCHPMECLPSLVALETCIHSPHVRAKAQSLHRHLIGKAGSNISFRYALCARAAYELHVELQGSSAMRVCGAYGADTQSCFQPWYDTIAEHQPRAARTDLLKALLKSFDVRTGTGDCKEEEVLQARFVAESLSTLNFKTFDEVQYVIDQLQSIMDVAGEYVRVFAMEEIEVDGEEEQDEEDVEPEELERVIAFGRMATILTFAILLRQHLMEQFGISESIASATRSSSSSSKNRESRQSNRAATRKLVPSLVNWVEVPGAQRDCDSQYQLAKHEMRYFENLVSM